MKILSSFTDQYVISNLYDLASFVEWKKSGKQLILLNLHFCVRLNGHTGLEQHEGE